MLSYVSAFSGRERQAVHLAEAGERECAKPDPVLRARLLGRICLPDIDTSALAGLKFSEALPPRLATATLAARLADLSGAAKCSRNQSG